MDDEVNGRRTGWEACKIGINKKAGSTGVITRSFPSRYSSIYRADEIITNSHLLLPLALPRTKTSRWWESRPAPPQSSSRATWSFHMARTRTVRLWKQPKMVESGFICKVKWDCLPVRGCGSRKKRSGDVGVSFSWVDSASKTSGLFQQLFVEPSLSSPLGNIPI